MDVVISTKLRQGGTEMRVRKQKDADVGDEIRYFEVKEFGQSIVLVRSENVPTEIEHKPGKSRYDWASTKEVVRTLESMNGKASTSTLVQEIAGRYGLDTDLVRRQLQRNDDLAWLRPDKNTWAIPTQEYDL
jgi:hypothetical protein